MRSSWKLVKLWPGVANKSGNQSGNRLATIGFHVLKNRVDMLDAGIVNFGKYLRRCFNYFFLYNDIMLCVFPLHVVYENVI